MKVTNKTWILTGAGNGIGRELCLQLLAKGATVAAADIDMTGLQQTQQMAGTRQDKISLHKVDITNKQSVEAFVEEAISLHGGIDGVINNAGIIQPFVGVNELTYEQIDKVMQVNFYGTLYFIKTLLPHLLTRSEAHIVNIASMASFIPFPGQSVYSASKAAVRLMTEGLYSELIDTNVRVTVVMPGAIDTNITKHSNVAPPVSDSQQPAMKPLPPAKAANRIIDAIESNKPRITVGSDAAFLDKFYRLAPVKAIQFITNKMKQMRK